MVRSFEHRKKSCRTSLNPYKTYEPVESPLCGTKESCIPKEEHICEEEVFDMSQIRYRTGCQDTSRLKNHGIPDGARLDYVIEDVYSKLKNIEYVDNPVVPGKPHINSFQGVISDLYDIIKKQQEEIELLKKQINE